MKAPLPTYATRAVNLFSDVPWYSGYHRVFWDRHRIVVCDFMTRCMTYDTGLIVHSEAR